MDNPETLRLVVMGLITVAAVVGGYVIVNALIGGDEDAEKRLASVTENKARKSVRMAQDEQVATRRKAVSDTLKDLEERQKSRAKVSMRVRLERAGLDVSVKAFWIASAVFGALLTALIVVMMPNASPVAYAAVAFIGVFGIPRWFVSKVTKRRQAKFLNEFANAIDVIVRGVKSGLPLNECLQIIARESPSPVREEFRELVEQQRVGITLSDAFDRMMNRLPLPEVNFFAIVVGIQQQSGGNLSEALGNLSGVLRDRKTLAAKVQAMSSEAKASASVLGSLPFIVTLLVYLTSPGYVQLLWSTKTGNFLIMIGLGWMAVGIMVMKKMINFKF
jgi:tight adherence protein B